MFSSASPTFEPDAQRFQGPALYSLGVVKEL